MCSARERCTKEEMDYRAMSDFEDGPDAKCPKCGLRFVMNDGVPCECFTPDIHNLEIDEDEEDK